MADRIRMIPNEAVPRCGSFEIRFPDGPSRYFYWDDIAGRRLRPDLVDRATAKLDAQSFARSSSKHWTGEAPTIRRTNFSPTALYPARI